MIFENNMYRYLYRHLEIKNVQTYFLILLILDVPLQISRWTPRGTCTPGWEPLS